MTNAATAHAILVYKTKLKVSPLIVTQLLTRYDPLSPSWGSADGEKIYSCQALHDQNDIKRLYWK
jgi:hypothetical protein